MQHRPRLQKIYSERSPQHGLYPHIKNRESEIWTPILLHAKLAGGVIEERLLAAQNHFSNAKAEIESTSDWNILLMVELLEVVEKSTGDFFKPGTVIGRLSEGDAWGRKFKHYNDDEKGRRLMSSAVGRYIGKQFRLAPRRFNDGNAYPRKALLDVLSRHTPEKGSTSSTVPPEPLESEAYKMELPEVPREVPPVQPIENKAPSGTMEPVEPFWGVVREYIKSSAAVGGGGGTEGEAFSLEELEILAEDGEL